MGAAQFFEMDTQMLYIDTAQLFETGAAELFQMGAGQLSEKYA